jgi:hypothetical protein
MNVGEPPPEKPLGFGFLLFIWVGIFSLSFIIQEAFRWSNPLEGIFNALFHSLFLVIFWIIGFNAPETMRCSWIRSRFFGSRGNGEDTPAQRYSPPNTQHPRPKDRRPNSAPPDEFLLKELITSILRNPKIATNIDTHGIAGLIPR